MRKFGEGEGQPFSEPAEELHRPSSPAGACKAARGAEYFARMIATFASQTLSPYAARIRSSFAFAFAICSDSQVILVVRVRGEGSEAAAQQNLRDDGAALIGGRVDFGFFIA